MFSANNWPRASALAIIMIVAVIVPLLWLQNSVSASSQEERK
jgi:putrescine transport system permease protein